MDPNADHQPGANDPWDQGGGVTQEQHRSGQSGGLSALADVNVDDVFSNDFTATRNTSTGWTTSDPSTGNVGFGLQLENVGNSQFGFVNGFARTNYHGPDACHFAVDASGTPVVDTDGSIMLGFVDVVFAKKSRTTTLMYKGF